LHALRYLFQVRIKQMAVHAIRKFPAEYIEVLPPSPQELLRQHPVVARHAFSATALPVTSPLCPVLVSMVSSRITVRKHALQQIESVNRPAMGSQEMSLAGPCIFACV
jgi:hypothetical protein